MANAFSTNFPIPGVSNCFQVIWQLTRVMKAAGWTYMCSGDGTTKETTGVASSDLWGGNANPLLDTYSGLAHLTDNSAGWWVGQGPTTLRIPLLANPSGVLLRGETITQAVSNAEGELFGFVWDTTSSSGWAIVGPHTGTFNNTNVITGSTSAATFTPNGTIVSYVRQIALGKIAGDTNYFGNIYYVCCDPSGESTNLFSNIAISAAGCTAGVMPGGGGTGNGFPALAICLRGTGGSTGGSSGWIMNNTATPFGTHAQIGCANNIPSTGITADGSFYILASSNVAGQMTGFNFTRLDDTEPGDADPYAFCGLGNQAYASYVRTSNGSTQNSNYFWSANGFFSTGSFVFFGYQARGVTTGSRDVPMGYISTLARDNSNTFSIITTNTGATLRTLNTPATTPPIIREPILLYTNGSTAGTTRQWKGRCRWIMAAPIGAALDTYDNKSWIASFGLTAGTPAILIGPYDGATVPTG